MYECHYTKKNAKQGVFKIAKFKLHFNCYSATQPSQLWVLGSLGPQCLGPRASGPRFSAYSLPCASDELDHVYQCILITVLCRLHKQCKGVGQQIFSNGRESMPNGFSHSKCSNGYKQCKITSRIPCTMVSHKYAAD